MPDLSLERTCGGIVAGVDEAGRGPWAGPVVAAAVILPPALPDSLLNGLDDIGMTLLHADEIRTYEANRRLEAPWLFTSA